MNNSKERSDDSEKKGEKEAEIRTGKKIRMGNVERKVKRIQKSTRDDKKSLTLLSSDWTNR